MDEESFLDRIDRLLSPETPAEMGATFAAESTPYLGTGMDIGNFLMGLRNRDAPRAGAGALAALLPFIGAATIKRLGEAAAKKIKRPKAKFLGAKPYTEVYDKNPGQLDDRMRRQRYYPIDGKTDVWIAVEPRELDFNATVYPELIEETGQLDLFPRVELSLEATNYSNPRNIGHRGIRGLGRAVIEDFEKAHAGLYRVAEIAGDRATGVHGSNFGGNLTHRMRLPRSFFFK